MNCSSRVEQFSREESVPHTYSLWTERKDWSNESSLFISHTLSITLAGERTRASKRVNNSQELFITLKPAFQLFSNYLAPRRNKQAESSHHTLVSGTSGEFNVIEISETSGDVITGIGVWGTLLEWKCSLNHYHNLPLKRFSANGFSVFAKAQLVCSPDCMVRL